MSKTTAKYNVTEIKQLIDLNGDKTNFELNFEVKSSNNAPFKALVISEADLNSTTDIKYQDVKDGYITGTILNDKGVYQTYFLLLKADKAVECEVTIDIKDAPLNKELQIEKENMIRQEQELEMQRQKQYEFEMQRQKERDNIINMETQMKQEEKRQNIFKKLDEKEKQEASKTNWLLVIGVLFIIGGFAIYYYKYRSANPPSPTVIQSVNEGGAPVYNIPPPIQVAPPPVTEIVQHVPVIPDVASSLPVETLLNVPVTPKNIIDSGVIKPPNKLINKINQYFDM